MERRQRKPLGSQEEGIAGVERVAVKYSSRRERGDGTLILLTSQKLHLALIGRFDRSPPLKKVRTQTIGGPFN
jgi:hypothetical protein